MNPLRRLLGASAWLLADRFLRLGLSFVVGVLVARHFGPTEFGQISFVVATAGVFGSLSSLGLDDIVPRDLAQSDFPNITADEMQRTALMMRLVGGSFAYALLLGLVLWTDGLSLIFWIAVLLGPYFVLQATDVYEYRLRVDGQFAAIARARTVASLCSNVLKALVVWAALPITCLAAAMTAEFGFNALFFRKIALANAAWGRGRFRSDYARYLLGRSWKIILAGLLIMLQSRVEYFLVEHFLGWESVGQYAAALKVVELFDVVTVILVTIMLPEFARHYKAAPEKTARQGYLLGVLSFLILVPVMVVAIWVFPLAYGTQFLQAYAILPIFMLRPFFIMLNSVRNMLLVIEHKLWYPPFCALLGATVSVGLGYLLIPRYELLGAVISALFGLFASTILADLLANRRNLMNLLTCWHELVPIYRKLKGA